MNRSNSSFTDPLRLEDNGDETFTLLGQFRYHAGAEAITVPDGFVTDFASVPRVFWNIIPPHGKHGKAAVVHDFLYSTRGLGGRYTRAQCDAIFLEAMAVLGVAWLRRQVMYLAVRCFGWLPWSREVGAPIVDHLHS